MYMNVIKRAKVSITVTFLAMIVSSCSLSLIPFITETAEGELSIAAYVIAGAFWFGLLLMLLAMNSTRRILYRHREEWILQCYIEKNYPIGILSFSKDWRMLLLYGTTVLGLLLVVTDIIIGYVPEKIMFPIISVTILSFMVHCVVDGKYYKSYKQIKECVNNETNC